MDEGSITMPRGVVVVYFSRFGKPLQAHHKVVLDLNAEVIAKIKGCEFGGHYDTACDYSGPLFFVPDDTLLLARHHVSGFVPRMISTAASSPIFSRRRNPSPMASSIVKRSNHWAGPRLSPSECGRSCCRATPYSATAMPE
jgi:hypothetical protein